MITTIATSLRHCNIVFNLRLSKNSLQLRCRTIYFFNIINDKTTAANIVKDPEFESTVFPLGFRRIDFIRLSRYETTAPSN